MGQAGMGVAASDLRVKCQRSLVAVGKTHACRFADDGQCRFGSILHDVEQHSRRAKASELLVK
jgi:hypothetical protein